MDVAIRHFGNVIGDRMMATTALLANGDLLPPVYNAAAFIAYARAILERSNRRQAS